MSKSDIAIFIEDCCVCQPGGSESMIRLWDAYLSWCKLNRKEPCWPERFAAQLVEEKFPTATGYVLGLALKSRS